jgi:D-cysteine desulfhydrase family pyridoxal phosphate-dependent enzyme
MIPTATEHNFDPQSQMNNNMSLHNDIGQLSALNRVSLCQGETPLEPMPNLMRHLGSTSLYVKRDDCMGFAFGGNKIRQLEFYFGEALAQDADTVLITGAVQSNFVRLAAAAANKLGLDCHIQLEHRVANTDDDYDNSGNVLVDKLLGATIHTFPEGEDEAGADRQLGIIAKKLKTEGKSPYIIPLAPVHPPLGALGYVVAAQELLGQFQAQNLKVDKIVVASGSGATHAGLLCGLRALGSSIEVQGICVRRNEKIQRPRLIERCVEIGALLEIGKIVIADDILLDDEFLAPGYGVAGRETLEAILLGARKEALMLDPTYTGKSFAGFIKHAKAHKKEGANVFLHTGGTPGIFAYRSALENAI